LVREVHAAAGQIAVITALEGRGKRGRGLESGAFDYLTKPVDLDQLRLLVRFRVARAVAAGKQATRTCSGQRALGRLIGESTRSCTCAR